jgi:uncharacterized protein YjiK
MQARARNWAAVSALAALAVAAPAAAKVKKDEKPGRAEVASPLGPGTPVPVAGVREPSGVAWHPGLERLFVVGDDGSLAELDAEGAVLHTTAVGGNLEDVTVHGPSGLLVLLAEASGELVAWDPRARRETGRFPIDAAAILGRAPADRRQGFEGLFFHARDGQPGGGVFYLVHQRGPSAVVEIAFDPTRPGGAVGAEAVVSRWPDPGFPDLTAITLLPGHDRMLVISESRDRLLSFGLDGAAAGSVALPGLQQEGACVDGRGRLWIADDRSGALLRFDDAASALPRPGAATPAKRRRKGD